MSARQQSDKHQDLILVGIGASAGGLAALQELLEHTPKDGAIAYVVVVHLSPDHESYLADLLQAHSDMPVIQVTEDMPIEPNRVYVIPPGRNLSTIDAHLRLSPLEAQRRARAPIDHFFRTLADQHKERAIAVVLSGTGSDGAVGIGQVKEFGGLAVAQDPDEAEYPGMPESAIVTGLVDLVLPLREIPAKILQYATSVPKVHVPDDDSSVSKDERELLRSIFAQIRAHTNHDFTGYKPSTVMRRITRRMQLKGVMTLENYLERLRRDREEVEALFGDLLITVTSFFRDPETFVVLEREVIPALFANKGPDDTVRVWVAGCASGEEAYSVAMLLTEYADRLERPPKVQIFATDVYPAALTRARNGLYPKSIAADLSEERIKRFFLPEGNFYRVRKELRERVLFAPHNLLADPPFSKLDLITCRNMLIYLNREVQREIFRMFHYALRESGYLFLGTAESVAEPELFREANKHPHLYRRERVTQENVRLPNLPFVRTPPPALGSLAPNGEARNSYGRLHAHVLERYAPPSVLVNPNGVIVHLSQHAGRFLQQPGGEPTDELLRRVRDPLRAELRTALYQVGESQHPVVTRPLPLTIEGKLREVVLSVRPVPEDELTGFTLVIFDERDPQVEIPGRPSAGTTGDNEVVEQLEARLEATKRQLQTVIEEFETSREEMKASNEELQSMNEELRSTAEELETSKEELQSINEELITVNQENRHKVEELSQVTSDLQNLLAATDIATLFLDREGHIMRFTPRASELFNILPTDRGRPLSDLSHHLGGAKLSEDTQQVLRTLQPIEREVTSDTGHIYLMRLLPYRSTEERIDGVVLTFIDIDRIRRSEEARRRSEERLKLVIESAMDYAIFTTDPEGRVDSWNQGAEKVFGFTEKEIIGEPVSLIFTPEDREAGVPERELKTAAQNGRAPDKRWHLHKSGKHIWIDGITTALRDLSGQLYGFAKIGRDDTEQKEVQEHHQFLLTFTDTIRPLADAEDVMAAACRLLVEHLDASRAQYTEVEGEPGTEIGVVRGEFVRAGKPMTRRFELDTYGEQLVAASHRGETVVLTNIDTDARLNEAQRAAFRSIDSPAAISVPLVKENRLTAIFMIHNLRPRDWREAEIQLIAEVAERTWAAVERASAEAALHASEEQYRTLFNTMDEAYAVVEVIPNEEGGWCDFLFLEVNPAFLEHTGMDYPVGKTATELLGTPNPLWAEVYGQVVETGESKRIEGHEETLGRTFDLNIFRLGDPQDRRVAVLFTDITERKAIEAEHQRLLEELQIFNETLEERVAERTKALEHSEQRFSRAFHAGPVAACITSLGRETFIEVNNAFLKLTGYERDEVIGRSSFELGMWSSKEDREKIAVAQQGEQGFQNLELSLHDKSGNIHNVLMSAEAIDLGDNRCYLKMFYDVTDRKRTEVQLMMAIQDVMSDTTWFSHSLLERLAQIKTGHTESDEIIELTPRERQVLERVAQGKNNEQIAEDLGLASQTVRNYITNIYSKIGVSSRSEAIVWARERGLVAL